MGTDATQEGSHHAVQRTMTPEFPSYYGATGTGTTTPTTTTTTTTPVTPLQLRDALPPRSPYPPRSSADSIITSTTTTTTTKRTTHNDPSLQSLLETEHLKGSTRMLKAYYEQQQQSTSSPQQQQQQPHHRRFRRWSTGDGVRRLLPEEKRPLILVEPDIKDNNDNQGNNNNSYHHPSSSVDEEEEITLHASRSRMDSTTTATIRTSMRVSLSKIAQRVNVSFLQDARSLAEGTIPQSIVLSLIIGIVCGLVAYLYYTCLFFLLDYCWKTIPELYVVNNNSSIWQEEYYWLYAPLMSLMLAILVGCTVILLGEPGDLPFTISCVHKMGYIPMDHVIPMVCASLFSILAGGSLGPEAPLVAICGALGGFVSRQLFGQTNIHVIRKHTFMGMAGALSAFFGCPLGGSIFALEVNSRFGIEYFEHTVEAIFAGEITLIVFRGLSGLPIKPIWNLTEANDGHHMTEATPWVVVAGGCIGLVGAFVAYLFAVFHWANMTWFDKLGLLDNKNAIYRALLGGLVFSSVGSLFPHVYFWGEEEIQVVATMSPASDLPFVWPTRGLIGFELDSPFKALLVGFAKIITISFTVAGGFRGGYIFPLFMVGAAFGVALNQFLPWIPLPVATLSFSAATNTAITRTSMATTIILGFLSGEPCAVPAILAASLCSLFATAYLVSP